MYIHLAQFSSNRQYLPSNDKPNIIKNQIYQHTLSSPA